MLSNREKIIKFMLSNREKIINYLIQLIIMLGLAIWMLSMNSCSPKNLSLEKTLDKNMPLAIFNGDSLEISFYKDYNALDFVIQNKSDEFIQMKWVDCYVANGIGCEFDSKSTMIDPKDIAFGRMVFLESNPNMGLVEVPIGNDEFVVIKAQILVNGRIFYRVFAIKNQ